MAFTAKTAYFYLVTTKDGHWKWGITTQPTYRKRSSNYIDCHIWEEIPSMDTGRRIEEMVGGVVSNITRHNEEDDIGQVRGMHRLPHMEGISQAFPLHILADIVRCALNKENWTQLQAERRSAIDAVVWNRLDEELPPIATRFLHQWAEWEALQLPRTQPEPMWV